MASVLENYVSGTQDPSVTPTFGFKGQLFVRIGALGGSTFQKQDNGTTTNWTGLASTSNIDGGTPASVYTLSQFINGGTP